MNTYVITIARGFGSGGKAIGQALGKRLGIPCFEEEILRMASEESGVNEALFNEVDEKLRGSFLLNHLKSEPKHRLAHPSDKDFTSDNNLFNLQAKIITELAKTQSCIIVGKCADYVLGDAPNVVKIYIEAPRKECLESIMEKRQVSKKEAERLIVRTDKYRADYYKYYTGGGYWTNPTNYDMTLNSARVGREKCVDVIINYLKLKELID